jgi:hypothetical protein
MLTRTLNVSRKVESEIVEQRIFAARVFYDGKPSRKWYQLAAFRALTEFARNPGPALLRTLLRLNVVHVACYATSSYVIHSTGAPNFWRHTGVKLVFSTQASSTLTTRTSAGMRSESRRCVARTADGRMPYLDNQQRY